jgi:hypothetical protein
MAQPGPTQEELDQLYAELVAAHANLTPAERLRFDAKLLLLLIARLDDPAAARALIREALRPVRTSAPSPEPDR